MSGNGIPTNDPVPGDTYLAKSLRAFFTPQMTRDILLPLLNQSGPVSLRTLDWLVVNYSKKYNVVCHTKTGSDLFNIHNGYKVSLSVYRRRAFDPFRRRDRHTFVVDGEEYETTLGQVNFVFWAYTNGVLDYAYKHAETIEHDMNSFSNAHKSYIRDLKKKGIRHKRTSLTRSNPIKCHVYHAPATVSFSVTGGD